MKSETRFISDSPLPSDPTVPPGYEIEKVLRWGINKNLDDSNNFVMITEAGCSTEQQHGVGSFQVIPLCIVNSQTGEWVRDWSAVTQKVRITHDDMMRIANVNLLDFGHPQNMSDDAIRAVKDVRLADGYTLNQKMKWLYNNQKAGNPDPYAPMWGYGEWYAATWKEADGTLHPFQGNYGCMAWGGRQIAASRATRVFSVVLPAEPQGTRPHPITMRQICPFTRDDFGTRLEWLMPRATVANHPGSQFGDYPRGYVYSPGVFERPGYEYWIPISWLEKP